MRGANVIDGKGRTLMPGLIDGHAHVMINADFRHIETNMDLTDLAYRATRVMERFLMDGFTAVRDMGGPTFGLQYNIDAGIVLGPRLYPSGAFISQTSGHGDFRERGDVGFSNLTHQDRSNFERFGKGMSGLSLRKEFYGYVLQQCG
jgi:imidazolonepropionase-like amidohydrolase